MNNGEQSNNDTLDQVKVYEKIWDRGQIQKMILEVDKRNPKSQTTLECVELLTKMTHDVGDIDPIRVFAIMCVLNKGPIFSTVDPHIAILQKPESTEHESDKGNATSIFKMHTIDEELMKLLSE
jgi:hypothetical protein